MTAHYGSATQVFVPRGLIAAATTELQLHQLVGGLVLVEQQQHMQSPQSFVAILRGFSEVPTTAMPSSLQLLVQLATGSKQSISLDALSNQVFDESQHTEFCLVAATHQEYGSTAKSATTATTSEATARGSFKTNIPTYASLLATSEEVIFLRRRIEAVVAGNNDNKFSNSAYTILPCQTAAAADNSAASCFLCDDKEQTIEKLTQEKVALRQSNRNNENKLREATKRLVDSESAKQQLAQQAQDKITSLHKEHEDERAKLIKKVQTGQTVQTTMQQTNDVLLAKKKEGDAVLDVLRQRLGAADDMSNAELLRLISDKNRVDIRRHSGGSS